MHYKEEKDIFGQALLDYFHGNTTEKLWLNTSYETREEVPQDIFLRLPKDLQPMEKIALSYCEDNILDIGAGTGVHSLILQQQNKSVLALEKSPGCVEIMQQRGIKNIIQTDIFDFQNRKFQSILMMMNGIGIAGTIQGLQKLLSHLKKMLPVGGKIIFDSSDISYLYEDQPLPVNQYFGEIKYQYEYKGEKGDWFKWLYIDASKMAKIATRTGWEFQVISEDEYDQYLGLLTRLN
ncbi:class I SAM-dependent methyltransferase [Flexithrix dorotheae]|uniref:class I SAM-dependent methyltransferase n=1 Tax=Flexithrix dorotheae TaxID=70993 RepID=UPI0003749A27|nr:methyltransferase domain-containing protein [Flexithrix dorotheae]